MRVRLNLLAVLAIIAAALTVGLAACGDDDSGGDSGSTATAAAQTPDEAYAAALRDAAGTVAGLAGSVTSGDEPAMVASSIRDGVADWQSAIAAAQAADLTDATLVEQRDALVAASPAYVDAWTAVADEWDGGTANGLLELVQQRSAISDGTSTLATAVEGVLQQAGSEARAELQGVEAEIEDALDQVRSAG
jgi:hypothetical protein